MDVHQRHDGARSDVVFGIRREHDESGQRLDVFHFFERELDLAPHGVGWIVRERDDLRRGRPVFRRAEIPHGRLTPDCVGVLEVVNQAFDRDLSGLRDESRIARQDREHGDRKDRAPQQTGSCLKTHVSSTCPTSQTDAT